MPIIRIEESIVQLASEGGRVASIEDLVLVVVAVKMTLLIRGILAIVCATMEELKKSKVVQ